MVKLSFYIYFILFALFFFFQTSSTSGQTIRVRVTLQMDRLPPQEQELLQNLPQQLTDYANNYKWTEENDEIIIEISVNIIIETIISRGVGTGQGYRAQFLVSSPSGENYYDKACEFFYQQGLPLEHDLAIFNPLAALFDYYIYMVIAGELDTWMLRGGSKYYSIAQNIANQGIISDFSTGWKSRWDAVQLVTDGDHIPLREAKLSYYDCLYFLEVKRDVEKVNNLSQKVLSQLEQIYNRRPNSAALKRFFDAHYTEICSLFAFNDDETNIERLINMDPRHTETYRNCVEAF